MRALLVFTLALICHHGALGQISGQVTNASDEALPFATVYLKGTTSGVSTNADGNYTIRVPSPGSYQVVCQYLGYRTRIEEVYFSGDPLKLNFSMEEESILAPTVEIRADAEDPAYAIIRAAIARRTFHSEKIQSYACKSYIKGRFDIEEVPDVMLEVFIDNMNIFDVDSSGRGIIYLSESESSFYKSPPDRIKEIMHSSVISGFDNQFSFNNAISMDFSVYQNSLDVIRPIISPIANNALAYYRYKLLGTTMDEQGRLLNKIQVIPKSPTSPTFSGVIYVLENQWSVPQGQLILTTDHAQEALIDSIKMVFSAVEVEPDTWVDIQKNFWMRIRAFGFSASGGFNGVFSNYEMNPELGDDFFDQELFRAEESSNKKSEAYWDSIRPIPLTPLEEINYEIMDSLMLVRQNRLDSLVNNPRKFQLMDLLTGYNRYYKNGKYQFDYAGATSSGFNVVQGFHVNTGWRWYTHIDSIENPGWEIGNTLGYSIAEKRLRGDIYYSRKMNRGREDNWTLAVGRYIHHYRETPPLHSAANTLYSLVDENNLSRLVENDAIGFEYSAAVKHGVLLRSFGEFGRRRALVNNSDYSWAKVEDQYESNNPRNPDNFSKAFNTNSHIRFGLETQIVFGQRYISYPNRKIKIGSKYPTINLAVAVDHNFRIEQSFLHAQVAIQDDYAWSIAGDGDWNLKFGAFALDKPQYFLDYYHVDGNETIFGTPDLYSRSFQSLDYYSNSTNDHYVEAHVQHHFRGYFLDKLPVIRALKWNVAAGANYLYTPGFKSYAETYVGIENIGIHVFRFLRFDMVWSFDTHGYLDTNYLIGIDFSGVLQNNLERKRIRTSF